MTEIISIEVDDEKNNSGWYTMKLSTSEIP